MPSQQTLTLVAAQRDANVAALRTALHDLGQRVDVWLVSDGRGGDVAIGPPPSGAEVTQRRFDDLAWLIEGGNRHGLIGLISPGRPVASSLLKRHIAAFARSPEVTASAISVASTPEPNGDSDLVDGRGFGRDLLFGTGAVGRPASALLLRASALDHQTFVGEDLDAWWAGLVLEACIRGQVWIDPVPTPDRGATRSDAPWLATNGWKAVISHAARIGLLEGRRDIERALRYRTRRIAELLDSSPEWEQPSVDDPPAELVIEVIGEWQALWNASPQHNTVDEVGWGRLAQEPATARFAGGTDTDWLPRTGGNSINHRWTTFVLVAPDYTDSHGGVVAIHRLCDRLNVLGYQAYLEPIGERGSTRPGWRTPLRRDRRLDDAVVIYPEIVTGNLLGAPRVVRWLLNRPGWFTGLPMQEGPNDLIVSFDPQIATDLPVLQIPLTDPTQFFPKDSPGRGKLLWIGKGDLPVEFDRADSTLITNSWPSSRTALAQLLRSAAVLYTCDWLTSIIDESLLCGTPVVLIGDQAWTKEEVHLRPGMAWEEEGIERASAEVTEYATVYQHSLDRVDGAVEEFVRLVNDHFGRLEPPSQRTMSGRA